MDRGDLRAKSEPIASNGSAEVAVASKSKERDSANSRDYDGPPEDDCCPICFGDYNIACKSSCGHWFCACCIIMFWNYSRCALRRCKCPICCRLINEFKPESSLLMLQQDDEVTIKTLEKIWDYNCLFGGGARGLLMKVRYLPTLISTTLVEGLKDPNIVADYSPFFRLIAIHLAVLYNACDFNFIPTEKWVNVLLFDFVASFLSIIAYVVAHYRRRRATPVAFRVD